MTTAANGTRFRVALQGFSQIERSALPANFRLDADEVHLAADASGHARRREARLRRALEAAGRRLHVHDTVATAVPPGAVAPASSDHFAVFTPYSRHWSRHSLRAPFAAPRRVSVPDGIGSEPLPARGASGALSPGLARGGPGRT